MYSYIKTQRPDLVQNQVPAMPEQQAAMDAQQRPQALQQVYQDIDKLFNVNLPQHARAQASLQRNPIKEIVEEEYNKWVKSGIQLQQQDLFMYWSVSDK